MPKCIDLMIAARRGDLEIGKAKDRGHLGKPGVDG